MSEGLDVVVDWDLPLKMGEVGTVSEVDGMCCRIQAGRIWLWAVVDGLQVLDGSPCSAADCRLGWAATDSTSFSVQAVN